MKIFKSCSPQETQKIAKEIARILRACGPRNRALVLALEGDLGGGKTTFLQGFAKGLGIKEKILSPTFIIMRIHNLQLTIYNFKKFYHFDCYRIQKPKEIFDLGWKGIIENPQNIVAVEWAERIKNILPPNAIWLKFDFLKEKTRKIAMPNINE